MSQLVDILYYTWYNPNVIKRERCSQQNTTRNYKIMNKPIIIAEVDNLAYNAAAAVTNLLNNKYNTSYSELEFYGDRFKSVIKENYEDTIRAAILEAHEKGIIEYREGGLKFEEALYKHHVISTTLGNAYNPKCRINESASVIYGTPIIYIGTDYDRSMRVAADLRILVKFGVDHKRNRVLGNEDTVYVVNTLDEVEQIIDFYSEHPEMIPFTRGVV